MNMLIGKLSEDQKTISKVPYNAVWDILAFLDQ